MLMIAASSCQPSIKVGTGLVKDSNLTDREKKEDLDKERETEESDEHRTTKIIASAMSSLVPFLTFRGENKSMFCDKTLPTLDTTLWLQGKRV